MAQVTVWHLKGTKRWIQSLEFKCPVSAIGETIRRHGYYLEDEDLPRANSGETFEFQDMGMRVRVEVTT